MVDLRACHTWAIGGMSHMGDWGHVECFITFLAISNHGQSPNLSTIDQSRPHFETACNCGHSTNKSVERASSCPKTPTVQKLKMFLNDN